jgi:hypothetical protein
MIIALLVIQLLKDSMFRIDAENKLPYPDYGGPDFINTSLEYSIGELHKLVVENGGTFSMNLSKAVTHAIASQKKGIKYQAAANTGDVIRDSWFLEYIARKALLPLAPKYVIVLRISWCH